MQLLDEILTEAYHQKASDVHLVTGAPPIYRIDGVLLPQKSEVLTFETTKAYVKEVLTPTMWETLEKNRELDFSYGISGISRFRVNVFYQRNSLSLAFRIITF